MKLNKKHAEDLYHHLLEMEKKGREFLTNSLGQDLNLLQAITKVMFDVEVAPNTSEHGNNSLLKTFRLWFKDDLTSLRVQFALPVEPYAAFALHNTNKLGLRLADGAYTPFVDMSLLPDVADDYQEMFEMIIFGYSVFGASDLTRVHDFELSQFLQDLAAERDIPIRNPPKKYNPIKELRPTNELPFTDLEHLRNLRRKLTPVILDVLDSYSMPVGKHPFPMSTSSRQIEYSHSSIAVRNLPKVYTNWTMDSTERYGGTIISLAAFEPEIGQCEAYLEYKDYLSTPSKVNYLDQIIPLLTIAKMKV